ncbi:MAG: tRNA (adenosine(37)-N6)-dimethylallyltransferase MiaA, partial [Yaniella sp.]|nr:tRNA (adenosine(37)-N6)-dimethylallyltransferase MiaA [Yaniella sp.]
MSVQTNTPVIALVGATATGKTRLAVGLAHALDGEVVNADSMQFYKGMDIGTAKAPLAERDGIVHHLLDIYDLSMEASVAEFQRLARDKIREIRSRAKTPIL